MSSGPIRGAILAAWRLLRCNPFSHGGVDELSDRRLFRGTADALRAHRETGAAGFGGRREHPAGSTNRADLT